MSLPSETLTLDERGELAYILAKLEDGEVKVSEAIAELILWRRVAPSIRRNRYLTANPSVREVLDRIPGSRTVPAAYLPRPKRS